MAIVDKLRDLIVSRRQAYRALFRGPHRDKVLEDLAMFCRAHESTFHEDTRLAANLDGRREVWLRIVNHLRLSDEDLFLLATGRKTAASTEVPMIDVRDYHG